MGIKTLFLTVIFITYSTIGLANPKQCTELTGEKATQATSLLGSIHSYRCCTDTISKCLKEKPSCGQAALLAEQICNRVAQGESDAKIKMRIERRQKSLTQNKAQNINFNGFPAAGSTDAKINVMVYACTRCPFCSKIVPKLHKAVTGGSLKGVAKLYFKPFPLKNHKFAKEGGLAIMALSSSKMFWPFILKLYANFKAFSVDELSAWTGLKSKELETYKTRYKDSKTRKKLIESKKEGMKNGVNATPTLFINGKKYEGFLDIEELVSVIQEEADNLK